MKRSGDSNMYTIYHNWVTAAAASREYHLFSIFLANLLAFGNEMKWNEMKWHFGNEQGRIHGYPSRVRVGKSSAGEGH